ncbi:MAG TPA: type VI immunity family protein [Archangium sp.]|uniref:type VI immunity family protein n=1 Tax=Archangium sp. TaxID=1872627 RepID=UPI002E2F411E|nr:type VI immunity family protein [Archangium sp.]HEX5744649.1 type VI immunity family protein [Archangium sp.]
MSKHYPRIRIDRSVGEKQLLCIRESVSITFYMKRSHQEVVQHVMRAMDAYRRAVGLQTLGWYADPYSGDWDELDDKGWAYIRREMLEEPATYLWLQKSASENLGYEILYDGLLLEVYQGAPASQVSFYLPTEYLEEHGPGRVKELALELAAVLPFNSGHAGLCFHFPDTILGATRPIRDLAFLHPGMDIPGARSSASAIGTRVDGVHWLNFLGPPVLGELGGAAGLRERLHSPDTTVQELDGEQVLVTLGKWPEAGDTEQGHTLPAYRELARVLEPWLYMNRCILDGFSEEDMRRWQRRFLD